MAQPLPLKVRVGIRDLWDSPTSAVQIASDALCETLGCKISPVVEWQALWAEMREQYQADLDGFVPAIESIVVAWCTTLNMRLNTDVDPEWTEGFLNIISETQAPGVKLHIQPSSTDQSRPRTQWNSQLSYFSLDIPKTEPMSSSSLASAFNADFENMLKGDTERVDVAVERSAPLVSSSAAPTAPASISISEPLPPLPAVGMLPRPEALFKNTAPYFLIVDISKHPAIFVQCSHQASLELIAAYFKKWAKKNNFQNKDWPNFMRITLQDSLHTFGVADTLLIEPFDRTIVANPTMILAFIEGILGYKMVHTTGTYWVYKSEKRLG